MINVHLYLSQFLNESRILREARSLAKFGLFDRIDLVGTGGADLEVKENVGARIWIRRLGKRREDPGLIGKLADAVTWSRAVYREYREMPLTCVNCHSVATLPLGCALKWATGARLVYDVHELETETSGLRGVRKLGTKIVERALLRYADFSIFVGRSIDDWYRNQYALTNTAVVYNCPAFVDIEPTDRFRRVFGIPEGLPIFLYQGVISKERGVPKLVEAFAGLEQRGALVIMGYGELLSWVQSCADRQPNVFYHAAVSPDRLLSYTSAADYGLSIIEPTSLSYEYCMPNKLFEYLMSGKPVLVSPTREQRALVEKYGVGEVLGDTQVKSVRDGVLRLLSRDREEFAVGIDRVRREFCWERQEEVLQQIYVGSLGFELCDDAV